MLIVSRQEKHKPMQVFTKKQNTEITESAARSVNTRLCGWTDDCVVYLLWVIAYVQYLW